MNSLTEVVSNDDAPPGSCGDPTKSRVSFAATEGVTYRIAVDGYDGESGFIDLQIAVPPPPDNDDFPGLTLSGLPDSAGGTNLGATKQTGEPDHAGNSGGSSVWYSWTAPSSGTVTVDTCGSGFNTLLGIYTGR